MVAAGQVAPGVLQRSHERLAAADAAEATAQFAGAVELLRIRFS